MFRCEITGKVTAPGEKMHRIVVAKRQVTYPNRKTGWEIVKEIRVSAEGLVQWHNQQKRIF